MSPSRLLRPEPAADRPAHSAGARDHELRPGLAGNAGADWEFSRIPVHAPAPQHAFSGVLGGLPEGPVAAKDDDPLSAIVAGGDGPGPSGAAPGAGMGGASAPGPKEVPNLSKTTVASPTAADCGIYNWTVRWNLDKKAPAGGSIVQKVALSIQYDPCPAAGSQSPPRSEPINVVYWEAWPVHKGKTVTVRVENGAKEDDIFERKPTAAMLKSAASVSITAEARYHDGFDALAAGFVVTGKPPAWNLPMTWTDPGLSGGSNAVPHNLTANWDCCATGKDASTKTILVTE